MYHNKIRVNSASQQYPTCSSNYLALYYHKRHMLILVFVLTITLRVFYYFVDAIVLVFLSTTEHG